MMRLRKEREVEIGCLAEEVAAGYFSGSRVMPLEILEAEGITCSFGSYGQAFDGLLEYLDGRFHVYCNLDRLDSPSAARTRFTLAHELGHFYIDEHRNALRSGCVPAHRSFCEYESTHLVEKEADHFASHLLMPDGQFREVVLAEDIGLPALLAACEVFGTSIASTAIRYVRMDLFVSAVIKWSPDGFGWKWLSDTMYKMGYRKTIQLLGDIPRDSATAQAIKRDFSVEQRFFDSRTCASEWFPFVRVDSMDDTPLIEQAISLGRFGVLTFLYPEKEES